MEGQQLNGVSSKYVLDELSLFKLIFKKYFRYIVEVSYFGGGIQTNFSHTMLNQVHLVKWVEMKLKKAHLKCQHFNLDDM